MLLECPLASEFNWEIVTGLGTAVLAVTALGSLIYAICQWRDFRNESRIKHLMDLGPSLPPAESEYESEPLLARSRLMEGCMTYELR